MATALPHRGLVEGAVILLVTEYATATGSPLKDRDTSMESLMLVVRAVEGRRREQKGTVVTTESPLDPPSTEETAIE